MLTLKKVTENSKVLNKLQTLTENQKEIYCIKNNCPNDSFSYNKISLFDTFLANVMYINVFGFLLYYEMYEIILDKRYEHFFM